MLQGHAIALSLGKEIGQEEVLPIPSRRRISSPQAFILKPSIKLKQ